MTTATATAPADVLIGKAQDRTALIGVVGLGYVGLPLAMEFARAGFRVLGFDVNNKVVQGLSGGTSHIQDVSSADVTRFLKAEKFAATTDLGRLSEPDVVSICVPTPLSKTKDPDVNYVLAATNSVKQTLRRGQLIVLESTTYPGTPASCCFRRSRAPASKWARITSSPSRPSAWTPGTRSGTLATPRRWWAGSRRPACG